MLRFAVRREARRALPPAALARLRRRAARMLLAAARGDASLGGDVEAGLILTGDGEVQGLNRDHRGKDRPTDVLAFSAKEGGGVSGQPGLLGDVVISVDTARRQRGRKSLEAEIFFLWSHGLCHLLGYDHDDDAQEAEMNARMASLRAEGERRGRIKPA